MYRNRDRGEARKRITRLAHGAVIELHTNGVPSTNKHWHYDLRRGRLCIYGGLLRYIDTCIALGMPHLARKVVSFLGWYVEDAIGSTTTTGDFPAVA